MKIVLGDIEEGPLKEAVDDLTSKGAEALGVVTDVSDAASVRALRDRALDRFGTVHLVHNNAGIGLGGPIWEVSEEDWRWILGVNLWGVVHGVATFVPVLIEQGEGHVVNTASIAGLIAAPFLGPYNATKQAVVAISETLFKDLQAVGAPIGVSVLCPGFVQTRIAESDRNRPAWAPDREVPGRPSSAARCRAWWRAAFARDHRGRPRHRRRPHRHLLHPHAPRARRRDQDALRRHSAAAAARPDASPDPRRRHRRNGAEDDRPLVVVENERGRRAGGTPPGITAAAFASTKAATAASSNDHTGTVGSGTAPICSANNVHSQRPSTMPSGTPITTPIVAVMDACHATAAASWRWTNPMTLRSARSRRHRRTDAARANPRADDGGEGKPRGQEQGGRAHGAVIGDLGGVLDGENGGFVPAAVRNGLLPGQDLVRGHGQSLRGRPALWRVRAAADAQEDHVRAHHRVRRSPADPDSR